MNNRLRLLNLILLGSVALFSSCTIGRMVVYQFSDVKDYKRFPAEHISGGVSDFEWARTPDSSNPAASNSPALDSLLENSNTLAFLVIQNDTIRYEREFEDYPEVGFVPSFSMAKSVTSALVGIAIEEGHIGGVEDQVIQYIPELEARGWEGVTIEHVLQMTTGVKHAENYFNPFAGVARSYYGRNLHKQVTHLKLQAKPGTQFGYKSINTQILGEILVRATGQSLSSYLEEKLVGPMGFQSDVSWSLDQKRNGIEKAFCCLQASAEDFARFGRLYLHKGNWEGKQLVPEAWVDVSTRLDTSNGSKPYYQYQWWIPGPKGAFAAEGHLGQFIYVYPAKDLVIVRLGKNSGGVDWYGVFKEIAAQF